MIVAGNFLLATARVIDFIFSAYVWIIIGSAVVSWVNADPWNPIVRFLRSATEPLYRVIRRRLPFLSAGGIDFTPMVVIAAIYFLQIFLVQTLLDYARQMK
ncbi:MAG: YggT family protein [Candidatus Hydrogenedentota bacterium]